MFKILKNVRTLLKSKQVNCPVFREFCIAQLLINKFNYFYHYIRNHKTKTMIFYQLLFCKITECFRSFRRNLEQSTYVCRKLRQIQVQIYGCHKYNQNHRRYIRNWISWPLPSLIPTFLFTEVFYLALKHTYGARATSVVVHSGQTQVMRKFIFEDIDVQVTYLLLIPC